MQNVVRLCLDDTNGNMASDFRWLFVLKEHKSIEFQLHSPIEPNSVSGPFRLVFPALCVGDEEVGDGAAEGERPGNGRIGGGISSGQNPSRRSRFGFPQTNAAPHVLCLSLPLAFVFLKTFLI